MLNAKAIILVGARDFGRCPLASSLPTALWPVLGIPVLERLVRHLADQGIKQAVICSNGESELLAEMICVDERLKVDFYDELLPVGTAGCIRDAGGDEPYKLLIVLPASITCPPEIGPLIDEHSRGGADLTVMLNPSCEEIKHTALASGIYLCNSEILSLIPQVGYFDIKEGLIPEMLSAGKTIHAAQLKTDAGNFRDLHEYLRAIEHYIATAPDLCDGAEFSNESESQEVWVSAKANIGSNARIYGPAVIMDGATIADGAVVLGPTVLEGNTSISKDAVVTDSVLWPGAQVGPNCRIEGSVIGHDTNVLRGSIVQEKAITRIQKLGSTLRETAASVTPIKTYNNPIGRMLKNAGNHAKNSKCVLQTSFERVWAELPDWARIEKNTALVLLGSFLVLIAFIWSYAPGLRDLWRLWNESDEYSSGMLVPFLAIYIIWSRRSELSACSFKPSAWGVVAFCLAQAVRFLGLYLWYNSVERLSVVFSIAALILLLGGRRFFRKISPILLFLCLMLPWPNSIQDYLGSNLQRYATRSAVFCLEVIGYVVEREGNIIHIGDVSVAVVEACNGLRMITAFFVITGLVALLVNRAWWEKLIVLISSLPVALLCNTVRLTITAMFFTVIEGEYWEDIFHDFGGYAMMPLALAAIVGELWLLTKLTTLPVEENAIIITRQNR